MYGSRPITAEEHVLIMKTLSEDHIGFRKSPTVILILSIIASTGLRLGDTLQLKMKNITSVGGIKNGQGSRCAVARRGVYGNFGILYGEPPK